MIKKLWKYAAFRFSLISAVVWVLAGHAYAFFNDLFSHDALNALYASGMEERWKVELGRFVFPLYRTIFRGALATPWVIGLLTILWVALAVYVLAKIFELKTFAPIFFAAGILAVNRTMFCLGGTYLYELDIDMLSVFLAALSVYLWKNRKYGFLLGALPLVGTLGIYQCNISVAAVLVIFVLVLALVRGEMTAKEAFRKGLLALAMLAIGALIYLAFLKLISWIVGISPVSGYYNSITNILKPKTRGIFSLLFGMYRDYRKTVFYWPTSYPEILIICAVLFSLLATLIQMVWNGVRRKVGKPALVLAAVLLALVPAASNTAYVLNNGDVHDLMKYAVWMVFLLPLIVLGKAHDVVDAGGDADAASSESENASSSKALRLKKAIPSIVYVLVFVILADFVVSANSIYLKKNLEQHATLSLMTRVFYDIDRTPGYVAGETPICFIGAPDLDRQMPGFEKYYLFTGTWSGSAVASDNYEYFYHPYRVYAQYYLNEKAAFCSIEEYNRFKKDTAILTMPVYPEEGSIGWVDGVLIIHMSH